MWQLTSSFFAGFVVGAVFSFLRLPLPGPNNLTATVGVIALFLGYITIKAFFH